MASREGRTVPVRWGPSKGGSNRLVGYVDPRNVPYDEGKSMIVKGNKYAFGERHWSDDPHKGGAMTVEVK